MRFLSLFSGIEAASVAWKHLGWECVGVAEIDPFPCAVLRHHYPTVPNLGDVTKIDAAALAPLGRIDLVVFGFPCQDLSVAGKREGFGDAVGNKTRSGLFHDAMRIVRLSGARWAVAENVPGLFSSRAGRDFATVVGEMAGCEFDPPNGRWRDAGMAAGPDGLVEWCVLDAQFFNVAQRRERVFLVRDAGNWACRPPVLLERSSLRGDPAPSREAGARVAGGVAHGSGDGGGCRVGPDEAAAGHLVASYAAPELAETLSVGANQTTGFHSGVVRAPLPFDAIQVTSDKNYSSPKPGDPCHQLAAHNAHGATVAFAQNQREEVRDLRDLAGAVKSPGTHEQTFVAYQCHGSNVGPMGTVRAGNGNETGGVPFVPVAFSGAFSNQGIEQEMSPTLAGRPMASSTQTGVRRLTPVECARLQGFPDTYLDIPYRGKPACDGPKYKALGNSMAVPVMRWIGQRIAAVESIL